jgi:hypothetical protein
MRYTISTWKFLRGSAMLLCLGAATPLAYAQSGASADVPGQTIPPGNPKPKPPVQKAVVQPSSATASAQKITRRKTKTVKKAPGASVTTQPNVSHDEHGDPSQAQQNADGTLNGSDWH